MKGQIEFVYVCDFCGVMNTSCCEVETEENESWENETYTCVCESCGQEAEFYGESAETTCFERNGLI